MFKHVMEFLKQRTTLKKPLPKHYFASFLKDLSNENLVVLLELLATTIGKAKRRLLQLQASELGSHNTNKTKSSNHM
jgi:hypothetical protein